NSGDYNNPMMKSGGCREMYEDLLESVSTQFGEALAPARRFNTLLLECTEKLADLQLTSARTYSSIALDQARAALDISDMASLQAYFSNQLRIAETVSQKIAEDANTLLTLGQDFGAEIQKLAQENVVIFNRAAQGAQPGPTKATPTRKSA